MEYRVGRLEGWHIVIIFYIITVVAFWALPLEYELEGYALDSNAMYYENGISVSKLYAGFQVYSPELGGFRVVSYTPLSACSTGREIVMAASLVEPYMIISTPQAWTVRSIYMGGLFASLACSEEKSIAASIYGDGRLRLVVVEDGKASLYDVRGLEDLTIKYYDEAKAPFRQSSSWGSMVFFGNVVVSASRDSNTMAFILSGELGAVRIYGAYESADYVLVYGQIGGNGFLYDLEKRNGVVLNISNSRIVAAKDGPLGVIALVEVPGEPLMIARFIESPDGFKLVSLNELSISGSYVFQGYWASSSGLWASFNLISHPKYESIVLNLYTGGYGVVETESGWNIARLIPARVISEDYTDELLLNVEERLIRLEEVNISVINDIPKLPPTGMNVEAAQLKGGKGLVYAMTAFFGLAPWVALLSSLLGLRVEGECR